MRISKPVRENLAHFVLCLVGKPVGNQSSSRATHGQDDKNATKSQEQAALPSNTKTGDADMHLPQEAPRAAPPQPRSRPDPVPPLLPNTDLPGIVFPMERKIRASHSLTHKLEDDTSTERDGQPLLKALLEGV